MRRIRVIGLAALFSVAVLGMLVMNMRGGTGSVTLTFAAEANGKPLVFEEFVHTNPAGEELFRLRDFRVYVSNIVLSDGEKRHVIEDSYHLLRFDRSAQQASITLPNVPLRRVSKVEMSIGVDEAANGSIEARGDLDPNNRMAWNWEIGYKFLLLEGAIRVDGEIAPLVYHVGFDENRRDLSFVAPAPVKRDENVPLTFTVDIMKLFDGPEVIDMAKLQTVKMDRTDAARLAANFGAMMHANWGDP